MANKAEIGENDRCEFVKTVSILHNTNTRSSTASLMVSLSKAMDGTADCRLHHHNLRPGKWGKLKHFLIPRFSVWADTIKADVLILHTSVIFSATQILLALLTGTKIVIVFWDAYPESFTRGDKQRLSFPLKVYAKVERWLLKRANIVLLPSEDYEKHAQMIGLRNSAIFPMWPFTVSLPPMNRRTSPKEIHIGYAGALNPIRGLPQAIVRLGDSFDSRIILHLYSSGTLDQSAIHIPESIEIRMHGFVDQEVLVSKLRELDAGLVCLNLEFDLPAFPSKIVSYISSGIPVIYSGPELIGVSSFLSDFSVGLCLSEMRNQKPEGELFVIKKVFPENQRKALSHLALTEEKIAQIL